MRHHVFTSESVGRGHPDKVADQISDAILDALLSEDRTARAASEVMVTRDLVVLAGEISADAAPDLDTLVRGVIADIGYDEPGVGFAAEDVVIKKVISGQSPDIARGVGEGDALGAGDQGLMFGYATDQTDELMPLPIMLAHKLVARQDSVRRDDTIPGLRPDVKSQVSVVYDGSRPIRVDSVVLSTQHTALWNDDQAGLRKLVAEHILQPALGEWWTDDITTHVNPTGRFEIGGPAGDTGLTGRKIIVDTYGGWGRHGGGAFSGKDATKVDRSASYMARYIAKNVVAAGLASVCEVRLSYAIGVADPTAVSIDCAGTASIPEAQIEALVRDSFLLTPHGIIESLQLRDPIFGPTSYWGHFGRTPDSAGRGSFSWERTDRAPQLAADSGL